MGLSDSEHESLTMMITELMENEGKMNDWERGFISDQFERLNKYGKDTFMSPKQWSVVMRSYESVTGNKPPHVEEPPPREEDDIADELDDDLPF